MSGRYLLDTSIVFALFENDGAVVEPIQEADEVFIPSIVLGELYYGARRSGHVIENVARIYEFAQASAILPCDAETSRWYSVIKEILLQKDVQIPENDVWIAATALRYGLVLVTRDDHFSQITNLKTARW
jgi:tRNA(fMet)-specific endonuclease VapC